MFVLRSSSIDGSCSKIKIVKKSCVWICVLKTLAHLCISCVFCFFIPFSCFSFHLFALCLRVIFLFPMDLHVYFLVNLGAHLLLHMCIFHLLFYIVCFLFLCLLVFIPNNVVTTCVPVKLVVHLRCQIFDLLIYSEQLVAMFYN